MTVCSPWIVSKKATAVNPGRVSPGEWVKPLSIISWISPLFTDLLYASESWSLPPLAFTSATTPPSMALFSP